MPEGPAQGPALGRSLPARSPRDPTQHSQDPSPGKTTPEAARGANVRRARVEWHSQPRKIARVARCRQAASGPQPPMGNEPVRAGKFLTPNQGPGGRSVFAEWLQPMARRRLACTAINPGLAADSI